MLYFKGAEKARSVKQLLELGFSGGYYVFFAQTFLDEDCKIPQLDEKYSARRSFQDLYEIVITYFPSISKKKFAYILLSLPNIGCFYCVNIRRLVFLRGFRGFDSRMGSKYDKNFKDTTGICFNDIEALAESYKK